MTRPFIRPPLFSQHDEAYRRMIGKKFFALFPDLGTAKTYMLLRDFLVSWLMGWVDGALIIAPVDVHIQWLEEEWPAITPLRCIGAAWPDLPPMHDEKLPRLFTIYPEAFRGRSKGSIKAWNLCKRFLQSGRMAVIVDECQMIGKTSSSTTRRIKAFKPLAAYRRIASGYPAPKMIDYFTQYSFLNTEILKCHTKGQFMDRFCEMGGFKNRQIIGYKNQSLFTKLTAPYTYTVRLDECQDMPERTRLRFNVDLTPIQAKLIAQIKTEFRAVLDARELNLPLALQRLIRIQQITCGFLPMLDEKDIPTGKLRWLAENRTRALENVIDGIRGKVIVWSYFKPCIARLQKHFGTDIAVRYEGGMTKQEKADVREAFARDQRKRILFAQPRSAGTGLNGLTVARYMLYWNNAHDEQRRRQTERRIWRIGQSKNCVYGDFIARGSYDAKILSTIMRGQSVADALRQDMADWTK